jgi:hypothetical protein
MNSYSDKISDIAENLFMDVSLWNITAC